MPGPAAWRAVFVLALLLTWGLSLWPFPPGPGVLPHADKLQHALGFMGLAGLGRLAFGAAACDRLMLGLLVQGLAIELAQGLFTLHRQASAADLLADAVGLALAAGLWRLLAPAAWGPWRPPSPPSWP